VIVNIAALPAALVESELFGHERGAFTGAIDRREGRFELARNGTLFLDEIGDLDTNLQIKLLRVCEDGGFERVGGTTRLMSRARLVAATSRPVTPGSPGATLREDLYYRLGVIRIDVPPLAARRQDIPLLVDAFLRSNGPARRAVSEEAMLRLIDHDWPGNVRQLRHVIDSACLMSRAEVLDVDDLQLPTAQAAPNASDVDLRRNLEQLERQLIERALHTAQGNRAQAARLLGIRRALLYARMKHLGIPLDVKD
jgi:DNA-binding NtrC family response regulator